MLPRGLLAGRPWRCLWQWLSLPRLIVPKAKRAGLKAVMERHRQLNRDDFFSHRIATCMGLLRLSIHDVSDVTGTVHHDYRDNMGANRACG